jgi:hypothetical protein
MHPAMIKKATGNPVASCCFTSACSNDEHGNTCDNIQVRHSILMNNNADRHNMQDDHNKHPDHNKQALRNRPLYKPLYDKDGQNVH